MGETVCKGRSMPMDKLDSLVAQYLSKRLLARDAYLLGALRRTLERDDLRLNR